MTIEESYAALGLNKGATDQEINNAYKELIKLYHPDAYKGDKEFATEKTMQIVTAYRVLTLKERATVITNTKPEKTQTKKQTQDAKRQSQREEKQKQQQEKYNQRKQEKQQEKQQRKQEVKDKRKTRAENKQNAPKNTETNTSKPKFTFASIDKDYLVVAVLVAILIVLLFIFSKL